MRYLLLILVLTITPTAEAGLRKMRCVGVKCHKEERSVQQKVLQEKTEKTVKSNYKPKRWLKVKMKTDDK